ncbi:MAG: pyruvate ferredoxin oxidoreductase [Candidatus Limiplasma sp.]|nr:pyruvate ferredoxin oxidoreductase [Candidatus Limiplasma sp.]
MAHYKMLDGNAAAVEAMKMARVQVISAYPITPQSSISEKLSELVDSGELNARYIRVESEHSAMSCAIGAQLTGVRAATATASNGLALMHEVVCVASGCRVPIVMPIVNRSIASPWSLWCDHQDSMAERDSGWLQFYCENVQDVYDTMLCAYRIAEDARVQTPAMVCLDGFFLSHSMQKVNLPEQEQVDAFLGAYTPKNYVLDPQNPVVIDNLTSSGEVTEMKYQQALAFETSKQVMAEVFADFAAKFGRTKAAVEGYRTEDAEAVIVTLGSMSGTAKYVVDTLRAKGQKVGAVKITCFRPFPVEMLRQVIGSIPKVAVLDRTNGFGAQGTPTWLEVRSALTGTPQVKGYIAGLAGRDVHTGTLEKVFADILAEQGTTFDAPVWIDCRTDEALKVRQVCV